MLNNRLRLEKILHEKLMQRRKRTSRRKPSRPPRALVEKPSHDTKLASNTTGALQGLRLVPAAKPEEGTVKEASTDTAEGEKKRAKAVEDFFADEQEAEQPGQGLPMNLINLPSVTGLGQLQRSRPVARGERRRPVKRRKADLSRFRKEMALDSLQFLSCGSAG